MPLPTDDTSTPSCAQRGTPIGPEGSLAAGEAQQPRWREVLIHRLSPWFGLASERRSIREQILGIRARRLAAPPRDLEHREARRQPWPAGCGEQERPSEAVGHGKLGNQVQGLPPGRCRDVRCHPKRGGEVCGVDR